MQPLTQPAATRRTTNRSAYDAIDTYVGRQMQRLHIPGLSLAIVEGDKIMHLRGFGLAQPGGAAPSP